jgi:homoserine dehydrogenase
LAFKLGLLGLGTVGSSVVGILEAPQGRHPLLREFEIQRVGVRSPNKARSVELPPDVLTDDLEGIVTDPAIDAIVELMGGLEPARSLMLQAIEQGKHVVTANKAAIARYGDEIFAAAHRAGVYVSLEAAAGGGIPVIQPLKHALSANRLQRAIGIVNGTTNYILTQMAAHGADFDAVLAEAQQLGYAEADPSADVDGYDAADKLAILASLAFGQSVPLDAIHREGIGQVSAADISYADRLGFALKLLAIAQRDASGELEARVHPTLVPKDYPLASIDGVDNAILIEGEPIGQVMFFGPGAGGGPTASAVVSDLMNVAAILKTCAPPQALHPLLGTQPQSPASVQPIEALVTRFYARLLCVDRPGVLGHIGHCFGQHAVSLESIVQIDFRDGLAEIVVVTHQVQERNVRAALTAIQESAALEQLSIPSLLRVLSAS